MIAEYYPRRRDPALGIWAHRQALAARAAGAEVRVLVLERPVPPAAVVAPARSGDLAPLRRSVRELAAQPRRERREGLQVQYVRFLAPPRTRSYAAWERWARRPLEAALERLEAESGVDLVHAHYALPAGGAAEGFCASRGKPLVVSVHGGEVLGRVLSAPTARARVGAILRGVAAVLCNGRATLARAAGLAGSEENMRVVHLGAAAPASNARKHDPPAIATLGNVIARKRHEDVLLALARVPEARWRVIGDGPELPRLRALADRLGLGDRVHWLGRMDPDAALAELPRCALMAMPSVDEAFGVAYVEALACGVPAIGCRGEDGPEEIASVADGMVLVPPRDPAALAAAMASLLEEPTRLRELGDAARRSAEEHFCWERCGQATVRAYADALAAAPRPPA